MTPISFQSSDKRLPDDCPLSPEVRFEEAIHLAISSSKEAEAYS